MSDIVERLNTIREHLRTGRFGQREVWEEWLTEALAEIERLREKYSYSELDMDMHVEAVTQELRAEIERLRAACRDQAGVELSEENDRLIADNERLRAENDALTATLKEPDQVGYWKRRYELEKAYRALDERARAMARAADLPDTDRHQCHEPCDRCNGAGLVYLMPDGHEIECPQCEGDGAAMSDIKDYCQTQDLVRVCAERKAEIERLRAALRACLQVATDEYDGEPWQAIDLARRALEHKPSVEAPEMCWHTENKL